MKRKFALLVLSVILLTSLSCDLPVSIARLLESRMGFVEKPYTIVPDPTDIPPGFDSGFGSVNLEGMYEPVVVNINYDEFMCIYYQAHADSGVSFSFEYDLDAGTFSGNAKGSAHASEYGIWEAWADFIVYDISGTITRAENLRDLEFKGTGSLSALLREQAKCDFQLGDPTVTEKSEFYVRLVTVSGKIWLDGDHWRWSPTIKNSDESDPLKFFLRCINCDVTPSLP